MKKIKNLKLRIEILNKMKNKTKWKLWLAGLLDYFSKLGLLIIISLIA